ncbi:uncharacterized protein [Venturia canescens]|uniref:uncharacterized protein n=1 Tax=Venturia canescens TaxID=32260 RepID=UPI001C9CD8DB|nr:uncharacterized protein LOC122407188 [Venturia canescens]
MQTLDRCFVYKEQKPVNIESKEVKDSKMFCFVTFAVLIALAHGKTETPEIPDAVRKCAEDSGINIDPLPIYPRPDCFTACLLKVEGLLLEDGTLLDIDQLTEAIPKTRADYDEIMTTFKSCSTIKKTGNFCQTALKLFECFAQTKVLRVEDEPPPSLLKNATSIRFDHN